MIRKLFWIIFILFYTITLNSNAFAEDYKIITTSVDDTSKVFFINGNISPEELKITGGKLSDPPRAFLDFEGAVLTTPKQSIDIENSDITNIKIAQFSVNPNIVRVVFSAKSQEALTKIRVLKKNNSIAFRMTPFEPTIEDYAIVYEFEPKIDPNSTTSQIPRVVNVVKSIPVKKSSIKSSPQKNSSDSEDLKADKNTKYLITAAGLLNNQLFLTGVGSIKLNRPFVLEEPSRVVFDFPNSIVQNKDIFKEYRLNEKETLKIGEFEKNTVRVVISTDEPEKYVSILSPDLQSVIIAPKKEANFSMFPDNSTLSNIQNIDVIKKDEKNSILILKTDKPIIHSIRQTSDRLIFDLYNINMPPSDIISNLNSTQQFRGLEVDQLGCSQGGISLGIPLRKTLGVKTGLSYDGKQLFLQLNDKMLKEVNVIIGPNRKIVLDAGHGGLDVGANSGKIYEKDITLDIAKRVEKYLKDAGVKVVMTRRIDETLSLKARTRITNREQADGFVSIHVNASEKTSIRGVETHWFTYASRRLAETIHENLSMYVAAPDRGLFKSRFYVIHHSTIPSVLVEIGFISNKKEKYQMLTEQRKDDTARSISNGILLFFADQYSKRKK